MKWNIEHRYIEDGYCVQIDKTHNFYPTKRTYYNSKTGVKCHYPSFESKKQFLKWVNIEEKALVLSPKIVIEILKDCDDLENAIEYFESLNN